MNDAFKRILALARRTGDRLIVTDPEGQEAFVLLNLDQYEELLGGPKDEPPLPPPPPPAPAAPEAIVEPAELPVFEEIAAPTPTPVPPTPAAPANAVSVPVRAAEEPPTAVQPQKDEEFGEEQFYLEPVE